MRRVLVAALLLPGSLLAQTPAALARAVSSIAPADVVRRIAIIADDSMLGRATPSPQLEKVAVYIAAEFRRFGLAPGGPDGGYLQRYRIASLAIAADSSGIRVSGAARAAWRFGPDAVYFRGAVPPRPVRGSVAVVTGRRGDSTAALDAAAIAGKMLVIADLHGGGSLQSLLGAARPAAIVIGVELPEAAWTRAAAAQTRPQLQLETERSGGAPIVMVRQSLLLPLLAQAGLALDTAREPPPLRVAPLPALTMELDLRARPDRGLSAPNVIGVLEGSDSALKHEYVFFTGHMDHIGTPGSGEGCVAQAADSICNGADDDASGTTAVVMLARAFSQLTPRPKRSLVFMTVSGEERGLWGSTYYVEHPTLPLARTVADLNTDMIGRNWTDTIAVIGKEHSDLGQTLDRVAAAHPELRMTPIGDIWPDEEFYFRSDHYNFARKGVPILFFFNGTHADYHQVGDEVAKIDGEKEARIIRLDFYLGLEIANAARRPQWNPDSYRRIVEGAR